MSATTDSAKKDTVKNKGSYTFRTVLNSRKTVYTLSFSANKKPHDFNYRAVGKTTDKEVCDRCFTKLKMLKTAEREMSELEFEQEKAHDNKKENLGEFGGWDGDMTVNCKS
jgi:hypothetical protein